MDHYWLIDGRSRVELASILITAAIIGYTKTWTYVAWVALFSTLAGYLYGVWIDGAFYYAQPDVDLIPNNEGRKEYMNILGCNH